MSSNVRTCKRIKYHSYLSSLLSCMNCPPELLTSIFKAPYFSTMCSIKFWICSSLRIFVEGPTTTRPPVEEFLSKSLISFAVFSHFSTLRLAITTVAPSKASSIVIDRPMPGNNEKHENCLRGGVGDNDMDWNTTSYPSRRR